MKGTKKARELQQQSTRLQNRRGRLSRKCFVPSCTAAHKFPRRIQPTRSERRTHVRRTLSHVESKLVKNSIQPGSSNLPAASHAERQVPLTSRGHANGQIIVGSGAQRRGLLVESDLELKWATVLDVDQDVAGLKEQVRVEWHDGAQLRTHYFDFVAEMRSGRRVAMVVKPSHRAKTEKFQSDVRLIARCAVRSGLVDEVRVLTEEGLDDVTVRNARFLRNVRGADHLADAKARKVTADLLGCASLKALTARTNLDSRGFRALVRLLLLGELKSVRHELISPDALVTQGVAQ